MTEASAMADAVIDTLETGAVLLVGDYPDVKFTPEERARIALPLSRTLQRLSPKAASAYQTITDPVTVIAIAAMWGFRVMQVNNIVMQQRKAINGNGNSDGYYYQHTSGNPPENRNGNYGNGDNTGIPQADANPYDFGQD